MRPASPTSPPTRSTTCSSPRATSTPASGCGRWRSGATSRPVGSRRCSGPASSTPTSSSGHSAGVSRRSATSMPWAPRHEPSWTPTREGVNAWLDGHRGSLGLAFLAAGVTPEAVDGPRHGRVGQGPGLEPRWQLRLGGVPLPGGCRRSGDPARTDELFPPYREDAPVITPTGLPGSGGAGANGAQAARDRGATDPATTPRPIGPAEAAAWRSIAGLGQGLLRTAGLDAADGLASDHGIGSNNWVVGPEMSLTGGALLANDPHLGISMPSIWFINGLHCRTVTRRLSVRRRRRLVPGRARASSSATTPASRGARPTSIPTSRTSSSRPSTRRTRTPTSTTGCRRPFEVRHEQIEVAGAEPFDLEIRSTVHGPILNDVDERLTDAPPMAIRWAATLEPDRTIEAILGLNIAANFQDFRSSLALYGAPAQNFVYADVDGHIGYQFPGYVPIRSDPDDRGDRPVRGEDGSGEWTGRIPFDDLPWQFDPEDGLIVTANNAAVDADYPYFVAQEWDPGFRAERIREQIDLYGADGLTVEEMGRIQTDDAPLAARDIVPLLEDGRPGDRRRSHDRDADRGLGGCLRPEQPRLRRVECVAVPRDARHLRRRSRTARPRLRREPVLVGPAPPAARRSDVGMVGRHDARRTSPRPRTGSWRGRWTKPERSCVPASAAQPTGRGAASTPPPSARPRWARAGSARSSGTSTKARTPSPGPPARSTTPTCGSRRPIPTRPTPTTSRSGSITSST